MIAVSFAETARAIVAVVSPAREAAGEPSVPVSYTHLTLPTICSV